MRTLLVSAVVAALAAGAGAQAPEEGPIVPLNERSVEALIGALQHEDRTVRSEAAWALGKFARAALVPHFLSLLDPAQPAVVHVAAIEALGLSAGPEIGARVAPYAGPTEPEALRAAALSALVATKSPERAKALAEALAAEDPLCRLRGTVLAGRDAETAPLLAARLTDPDLRVRRQALRALAEHWAAQDEKASPQAKALAEKALPLLKDEEPMIRAGACDVLAELRLPEVPPALLTMLDDRHHLVRRRAARALGRHRAGGATVRPLIALLMDDDYTVRAASSEALGEINDRLAVNPLADRLEDRWPEVREAAKFALAKFAPEVAAGAVADKMLRSRMVEARRPAAWIVGEWGSPIASDSAAKALADEDVFVRAYALRGLRRAGDERAVPHALKALDWERRWVKDYVEILEAYEVAIRFKDERFIPLILQRVRLAPNWAALEAAEGGPPAARQDVEAAVLAAGHFNRPELMRFVQAALNDDILRETARRAVAIAEGVPYEPPPPAPIPPNRTAFFINCFEPKSDR